MNQLIIKYALAWNPNTKVGHVALQLQNGAPVLNVPISSAEEFAAVAAILREAPVFLSPDGTISTNFESTGN